MKKYLIRILMCSCENTAVIDFMTFYEAKQNKKDDLLEEDSPIIHICLPNLKEP